jgi:hypothetical protein
MAGYSGTPLVQKLGIKAGMRLYTASRADLEKRIAALEGALEKDRA